MRWFFKPYLFSCHIVGMQDLIDMVLPRLMIEYPLGAENETME